MAKRIKEAINIIKMNDRGAIPFPPTDSIPINGTGILDLLHWEFGISTNGGPGSRLWPSLMRNGRTG